MLKKINRISSRKEFAEVKEKGEMVATSLFSIVWMKTEIRDEILDFREEKNKDKNKNRKFGAIISKKISKKAVERNRIRRRLMEAVRLNMDIFPEGFRGIFLVKKNILDKSEMEIEKCLKKLF